MRSESANHRNCAALFLNFPHIYINSMRTECCNLCDLYPELSPWMPPIYHSQLQIKYLNIIQSPSRSLKSSLTDVEHAWFPRTLVLLWANLIMPVYVCSDEGAVPWAAAQGGGIGSLARIYSAAYHNGRPPAASHHSAHLLLLCALTLICLYSLLATLEPIKPMPTLRCIVYWWSTNSAVFNQCHS